VLDPSGTSCNPNGCPSGQFLSSTSTPSSISCTGTCPTGQSPLNGQCVVCGNNCGSCSFTIQNTTDKCLTCMGTTFLFGSQCLSTCPSGTTQNNNQQCITIPSSCTAATWSSISNSLVCTSCTTGNILVKGQCINKCNVRLFYDAAQQDCISCEDRCTVCSDAIDCTLCDPNTFYVPSTKSCDFKCPANTYMSYNRTSTNNDCYECDASCGTCSGAGSQSCLTCKNDLFVTSTAAITRFNNSVLAGTIIAEGIDAGTCGNCQFAYGPIGKYCFPCPANCVSCM